MPRIRYERKRLTAGSLEIVETANGIIDDYREQGFTLTLRQLYYQFVARDFLPNSQKSYKRLGSIINDARLAGLIDWEAIEDRTRWVRSAAHWDSPSQIVEACADQFRYDLWESQQYRPQVWIEKDALVGVIEGVCDELDVPFLACRGYVSQSAQWRAGIEIAKTIDAGQTPIVFHLGDHDPSGVDMTRDNAERLSLFAGTEVEVRRLALNMDQIEEHSPPPNPAKLTDSRAEGYIARYGDESWELDALEPRMIADLIRTNVESLIDRRKWRAALARQEEARDKLRDATDDMR